MKRFYIIWPLLSCPNSSPTGRLHQNSFHVSLIFSLFQMCPVCSCLKDFHLLFLCLEGSLTPIFPQLASLCHPSLPAILSHHNLCVRMCLPSTPSLSYWLQNLSPQECPAHGRPSVSICPMNGWTHFLGSFFTACIYPPCTLAYMLLPEHILFDILPFAGNAFPLAVSQNTSKCWSTAPLKSLLRPLAGGEPLLVL